MRFEDVLHNGKLWAVVYDGDSQNILTKTFANWLNPAFLEDFFIRNSKDLESYFNITNLDVAVYDTITDAVSLSCMILDIRPDANLDMLFRPLENQRVREMLAIKLTHLMSEREHTLNELRKMEMVRNYLLDNGIVDADGIKEETL